MDRCTGHRDITEKLLKAALNTIQSINQLPCRRQASTSNTLPDDKNLDQAKSKAFADDKINVTEKLKFVFGRVENIVGKGENAGHQCFLLFPQCFPKLLFNVVRSQDCVVKS